MTIYSVFIYILRSPTILEKLNVHYFHGSELVWPMWASKDPWTTWFINQSAYSTNSWAKIWIPTNHFTNKILPCQLNRDCLNITILNIDFWTKSKFHKCKLNIKCLNNLLTEQRVNWPNSIRTLYYWTLAHLNFKFIAQLSIEQCTNRTIYQLNIAQFQLNKWLIEHGQIEKHPTEQHPIEHEHKSIEQK